MKLSAVIGFGSLWMAVPGHGLEPLVAHVDITPTYDTGSQEWAWALVADGVPKDPAASYFPGRDVDWGGDIESIAGERYERPAGSEWDFLGVAEYDPVWIFTELDNQWSWVGFGDTQSGTFSAPLRVTLAGVDGPVGGHFTLFDNDSNVFMKTSDGISAADTLLKPAFHTHLNWSFSRSGVWRVRLTVFGYRGPGLTNPTPVSAQVPLHFAIGGPACWRAEKFDAATVMDENVAGELADPDHDGFKNLLEYAFGGNPRQAGALRESGTAPLAPRISLAPAGDHQLQLTYFRRKASTNPGIVYQVEWKSGSLSGDWTTGGTEVEVVDIDSVWERVTVRDTQTPPLVSSRWARVKVGLP